MKSDVCTETQKVQEAFKHIKHAPRFTKAPDPDLYPDIPREDVEINKI